jgi:hypothetical protein
LFCKSCGRGAHFLFAGGLLLLALAGAGRVSAAEEAGAMRRTLYLSVQVAKYWAGDEGDGLKEISSAHPVVISSLAAALYSRTGLTPEVIERVQVIVYREFEGELIALRGIAPLDRGAILSKLTPGAREQTIAGFTCYTSETSGLALVPIDDRDVVFGRTSVVRALLEHGRAGREVKWLSRASTTDAPLLAVELDPAWLSKASEQPQAADYRPLLASESLRLTVKADKQLEVLLTAKRPQEAKPGDTEAAFRKVLSALDGYLATAGEELPKMLVAAEEKYPQAEKLIEPFQAAIAAARAAIEKPTFAQQGDEFSLSLQVAAEHPATTAMLLLSLMPRAAKKPAAN